MSNWRSMTLLDLCEEGGGGIQTGPFGSQLHASDYVSIGIPSVMPQNIGDNFINSVGIAQIAEEDAERLAKYRLREGDIVYSRRGDVEKRALVRAENDGWLCGTGCLRVRVGDRTPHDARFVSYLLGTEESRAWIARHAVGATMLNLNTSILGSVPLRIPDSGQQRAIGEVLGALDDKIAISAKLASTANAWVRAMYTALCAEAQDRVRLSELVGQRRDLLDPTSGPGDMVYVGLEHIPRRMMWLDDWGTAEAITSTKSRFREGDILFGKLRPYFHKVVRASSFGICSTDVLVLHPLDEDLAGYLLAAVASDSVVERSAAASEGTRMPRTSWKDLAAVEVPWPGREAAVSFSDRVSRICSLVEARIRENSTLAAMRDTMLPQLMAGKLEIRDAGQAVGEVL